MKWLGVVTISAAVYASTAAAQAHIRCQNTIGGPCGDSSRPREYNCCDYGYCQPWNSGYYQCIDKPAKCPSQETDIDYAGNDIKTVYGLQPDKCCDECAKTVNCKAYTFVNQNPDGKTACYLKTSAAGRVEKKGAVSATVAAVTTAPPTSPPVTTPPPPPPAGCPVQESDVDYYGNDLKSLSGVTQGACCDECGKTAKCVAYTYVSKDWDGKSGCYLKSSIAGKVAKAGVVSGQLPVTKPPQPPPNCPEQEVDVDYYGNDLKTLYAVTQTTCCDECGKLLGCAAYTFVDKNPDGKTACYLKSSAAGKVAKAGAVSGKVQNPLTTPPPTTPPPPANCPTQEVNVDYYGNDIKSLFSVSQTQCCDECTSTPLCVGYTYIAKGSDGKSACYLKSSAAGKVAKAGAVSGKVKYVKPPTNCPAPQYDTEYFGFDLTSFSGLTFGECCDACGRTSGCRLTGYMEATDQYNSSCLLKGNAYRYRTMPGVISSFFACPTKVYGSCGSAATGGLCCPEDAYCQPWNSKYYQCIPRPDYAKCTGVQTDVDFYGGDIDVKYGLQPGQCCDACVNNKDCVVYTFVNENPDGKTACYLKNKIVEQRAKRGAISGYRSSPIAA